MYQISANLVQIELRNATCVHCQPLNLEPLSGSLFKCELFLKAVPKNLLNWLQVSSLEARGRRQQKKGGSGTSSGSNNRRSKSENPLQRKLSVAQHLSLTTRPQVSLRHLTLNIRNHRPQILSPEVIPLVRWDAILLCFGP